MAIYKPTELIPFLQGLGISPRKGLSQNFLIDGNIIRKIIEISHLQAKECVVEVGPGPGALTEALLEKGAHVCAIEMDKPLAEALHRLSSQDLTVFNQDVLSFCPQTQLTPFLENDKKAKLIANLPYHLTTPILAKFCPLNTLFSSMTIMVQEEVGRRMTASPGTKDYSSLTVFLNFYSKPRYAFSVSRQSFFPIPKVDSAVVTLELMTPPLNPQDAIVFFKLTRTAFEHRRKMLRSSLKSLYPVNLIESSLVQMNLSVMARPETLSLNEFLQLYHLLNNAA